MLINHLPNSTVVEKCLCLLKLENFRDPYLDHGAKKLFSGKAILLFVEAFLHQRGSLWDLEENLKAKDNLQELTELEGIHSSTLYRKLEKLPTSLLQDTAIKLFSQIDGHYTQKISTMEAGRLSVIDSTEISLPEKAGEWAYSSKTKNGVKIHLKLAVLDEKTYYPEDAILSTTGVADKEVSIDLVIDRDATYVMDRGYINYTHFHNWMERKINFVVRVKGNSRTKLLTEHSVPSNSRIVRDAEVEIHDIKNDRKFPLRLVEFLDEKDNKFRILTTRRDLSAEQVAEIYRMRWKIELFFKWVKQHLKLVKLYNHKPAAVWNQLWLALIAYGISELIKIETGTKRSTWQVLKLLRFYWHDSWDRFIQALNRKPTKPSKGRRKKGKPGRPRKYPKKMKTVQIIHVN